MIADSADIRFECDKCGQHLVVEAAAAGLTADCPICNTGVTVPPRAANAGAKPRHGVVKTADGNVPYADPGPDALREELIDASLMNGKLLGDLDKARAEIARQQQLLKERGEEHERLNATATHAQRELKTFQTERQQLKGEAAALRQRISVAEEAIAARGGEVEALRTELESAQHQLNAVIEGRDQTSGQLAAEKQNRESVQWRLGEVEALRAEAERRVEETEAKFTEADARLRETEARLAETAAKLASTATDLDGALGRLGQSETTLNQSREQMAKLELERGELQERLDDAGKRLTAAAEIARKLAETEAELTGEREKLQAADAANRTLTERCQRLDEEGNILRQDLKDTHSGREVVEIRDLLAAANAESERLTHRLEGVEADLRIANATGEAWRTERDEARAAHEAAREDAAALRDSSAIKDNEVLRGIVARLNAELAQRTGEAARLKRAQYGLKIVYGIFGIGLLAVIGFALAVLPRFVH